MTSLRASPLNFFFESIPSEAVDVADSSDPSSFSMSLPVGASSLKMVSFKLLIITCLELKKCFMLTEIVP